MKKTIFIASSFLVLFTTSCKKCDKCNHSKETEVTVTDPKMEVPLDHVVMVAGEEVPINANMDKYIRELKSKVDSVQNDKEVDYAALQSNLNTSLQNLMSSCTLGGTKYHKVLHKYLFPVKENIEQLGTKKSEGLKVIKENLSQLKCK